MNMAIYLPCDIKSEIPKCNKSPIDQSSYASAVLHAGYVRKSVYNAIDIDKINGKSTGKELTTDTIVKHKDDDSDVEIVWDSVWEEVSVAYTAQQRRR